MCSDDDDDDYHDDDDDDNDFLVINFRGFISSLVDSMVEFYDDIYMVVITIFEGRINETNDWKRVVLT